MREKLREVVREARNGVPPAPTPTAASPKAPPAPSPARLAQREGTLFLAEMAGVKPFAKDPRGYVEKRPAPEPRRTLEAPDEMEGVADLRDLVEGRKPFLIQYTDEYMEGVAPDVDRRLAQRLHQGDYAVRAHLDLHGHTVDEAKAAVDRFLTTAYATGQRCILLIHGRGHNSKGNRPILKEQVQFWLSHGRLSRMVLAFATAPATDGGAGAVYVLLRRAPHMQKKLRGGDG